MAPSTPPPAAPSNRRRILGIALIALLGLTLFVGLFLAQRPTAPAEPTTLSVEEAAQATVQAAVATPQATPLSFEDQVATAVAQTQAAGPGAPTEEPPSVVEAPPAATSAPTAQPTAAPQQGCPGASFTRYDQPSTFTVAGPAVVHPYRDGQPQYRVKLVSGESTTFQDVKGDVYTWLDTDPCRANLEFEFAKGAGAYAAKTVAELRAIGWVQ